METTDRVYHTQGGGTVRWDDLQKDYVFVDPPEEFPQYKAGDIMPEDWGIA